MTSQRTLKQGFSLIELMVVILIMSILICLAYPSYQHHLLRARRVDGQTALFVLANNMEDYFSKHDSYEKATIAMGRDTDVQHSHLSPEGWYRVNITELSPSGFRLAATATNVQQHDTDCQVLILDSTGIKSSQPQPAAVCWH